jgi:hypothetical protein
MGCPPHPLVWENVSLFPGGKAVGRDLWKKF